MFHSASLSHEERRLQYYAGIKRVGGAAVAAANSVAQHEWTAPNHVFAPRMLMELTVLKCSTLT